MRWQKSNHQRAKFGQVGVCWERVTPVGRFNSDRGCYLSACACTETFVAAFKVSKERVLPSVCLSLQLFCIPLYVTAYVYPY